jgi:hypothetical protein
LITNFGKPLKDSPGKPGQDNKSRGSQYRTARTGWSGLTLMTGQREHESWGRTARAGYLEQDSWGRKAVAGQPGQDSGAVQLMQDS